MKSEIKCGDDHNSLSKEERKQKKEERRKKKRKRLDKQNSADVKQLCEDAAKNTSQDLGTESTKKNRKRKKHNSDSVGDEIVSEIKSGEHCINEGGKIKRQKTENIELTTNNNCDSSSREVKSKKKKRKKEKAVFTNPTCDTNELSCDNQDITQSVKIKIKKHKKTKTELADGECVMPAKTDSTVLGIGSDIIQENKSKKQKKVPLNTYENNEDAKDIDSKENNSSPTEEKSSKNKKKNKKHSKNKECESIDETDSINSRRKHKSGRKKKSKSRSDDEGQENAKVCDSVETQDIMKHVSMDVKISQTGDDKISKHKKQKKHSNNSSKVTTDKNFNGNQEICSEITKLDKPTSDEVIKPEPSPVFAAAALGNWQGNLFENNDRQNKFLRLLGGMKKSNNSTAEISKDSATLTGTKKKGLFGSLATLSNTASSAALDVNAAASLNQKLEDEYNRAMDFKLSGKVGTGFGFVRNPAEGKKFHIDVNKSKSVKFDD